MEIYKTFQFDAAHHLAANVAEGHAYGRLHGHSFEAVVYLTGEPDAVRGWIIDFGELEAGLADLKKRLDHGVLNDIDGLEQPTLENLAAWIWRMLAPRFAGLTRVELRRPSRGEGCIYRGP